jgi:hypothetical protein
MGGTGHFPKRSFKYVYIALLVITLVQLVTQLGNESPLGFMTLIDGKDNVATGRACAWGLFGSFAFFVFAIYMEMEAFEEKAPPFEDIEQPKRAFAEYAEWLVRVVLVALVTVKLWYPQSYQGALVFLAAIAGLLFLWSAITSAAFQVRWNPWDSVLLLVALGCAALSWVSSDAEREANFGLLILLGLFVLMIVFFSLGVARLMDLARSRAGSAAAVGSPGESLGGPPAAAVGATGVAESPLVGPPQPGG